jgi:hypothetical protein
MGHLAKGLCAHFFLNEEYYLRFTDEKIEAQESKYLVKITRHDVSDLTFEL